MSANRNMSLFRWEVVNFVKQYLDAGRKCLTSSLFFLSTRPSVQFEIFVQYGNSIIKPNDVRVILKQADGKSIEASVKIWIEHVGGRKFGETLVEKHVFSKVDDFCGYKGLIGTDYGNFWLLCNKNGTFYICCELTDLNGRAVSAFENYGKEFLQNQWSLYEQELHDAVIKVGETEFKIFKSVFMFQSEVFKSMFLSKFKEGITSKVEIKDIDVDTMKHFVKWFYTGNLEDDSPIEKLFAAADKYDVKLLKKMCTDRMFLTLDKKNAFDRLILASTHSDTQFKEDVLDFIYGLPTNAFTDFFGSDEWFDLGKKNEAVAKDVGKLIRDKMHE